MEVKLYSLTGNPGSPCFPCFNVFLLCSLTHHIVSCSWYLPGCRVQELLQSDVCILLTTEMNATEVWQEYNWKARNTLSGFIRAYYLTSVKMTWLLRAHEHRVISSANWHCVILLFSGKEKFILRKCYSNVALSHLKYMSRWFLDRM